MIRVAVCGSCGKMGQEVIKAVIMDDELELTAKIDVCVGEGTYNSIEEAAKNEKIDVLVDFTQPSIIFENAKKCLNLGIRPVIGTTGLSDDQVNELKNLSKEKNVKMM